jgi:beta-1,4-mannosyltransferase
LLESFNYIFYIILLTFWFSTIPVAFLTLVRFIRNRKVFVEKDLQRIHNDPTIIFQITTRSATKTTVVERGIYSIINAANKINYCDYRISIVTEDDKDKEKFKEIKNCEIIKVDKEYKTNAIKKSRALQFAVEYRRKKGEHTNKFWIFHMDDESYLTDQTLLSLLKFIREGKGIASEGPIVYPLKFEIANPITALAESVRPFGCYDCVSQMKNPPPLHMHGSNLLVRSDAEDLIGWNFGITLAEDQLFGYKLYEKYGKKALGWHGGILLEQPPLNIKDHFMQRRRWILGSLQNISNFPFWHRYKISFKLASYFMGFISGIATTILSVLTFAPMVTTAIQLLIQQHNFNPLIWSQYIFSSIFPSSFPEISLKINEIASSSNTNFYPIDIGPISIILIFPYLMWLLSYQIGLFLNLKHHKKYPISKKVILHIQAIFFSLVLGILETFPAFVSIIEYYLRKKIHVTKEKKYYDFYVVNK